MDHSYVYLGSLRICFGKENISYSFLRKVTHYSVQNSDYCVVDCYTHISSLTLHVPSSCILAIPEKTDFADKARQRKTFTASFSFCWIIFFPGRKEKYFENVISDICIRKHGLSLPWRAFKIFKVKTTIILILSDASRYLPNSRYKLTKESILHDG